MKNILSFLLNQSYKLHILIFIIHFYIMILLITYNLLPN